MKNNIARLVHKIWKLVWILMILVATYIVIVISYGLLRSPSSRLNTIVKSQEDCTVPCWQFLKPNNSTFTDFQMARGNFPSLRYALVRKDLDYLQNPIYHWFDLRTGMPTEIYLENNRIISIIFTPGIKARFDSQASSLTIDDVFSELGYPDNYIVETLDLGTFGNLYLFYENEGLVFTLVIGERPPEIKPSGSCTFPITRELPVRKITLVSPSTSENMLLDSVGEVFAKGLTIRVWGETENVIMEPCF